MSISIKTDTQGQSRNWYQYIWDLTGWEGAHGDEFSEVHFTMPKDFYATKDYSEMSTCPHITMVTKTGWTIHRYENKQMKYQEKNRLVKKGKQAFVGDVYSLTAGEKEVVKAVSAFVANRKRP